MKQNNIIYFAQWAAHDYLTNDETKVSREQKERIVSQQLEHDNKKPQKRESVRKKTGTDEVPF